MPDELPIMAGLLGEDADLDPTTQAANATGALDLAAAIDALSDEEVAQLASDAAATPAPAPEDSSAVGNEPPETPAEEAAEGEDGGDALVAAVDDPSMILGEINGLGNELAQMKSKLTDMETANDASELDDVTEVADAIEAVDEAIAVVEEATAEAEAAVDSEDPDAAASAKLKAQDALKAAKEAFDAAVEAAKTTASTIEEVEPDPWLTWAETV